MSLAHQSSDGCVQHLRCSRGSAIRSRKVFVLCVLHGVCRGMYGEGGKGRKEKSTPTLIAELRQAVLAEGIRLGAGGFAMQLGGSGSSETGEETSGAKLC